VRVGGSDASAEMDARTRGELDKLVELCSARELLHAVQLFNQAQLDLRGHDQGQLSLELAFVEAALQEAPAVPAATTSPATVAPAVRTPAAPAEREREPAATETASAKDAGASRPVPPSAPPKAPPRAPARAPEPKEAPQGASEPELQPESVSAEYIARMRGEISGALRAEGPAGRKADGLFGTVFHIGEIKVLAGSELLFGLPRGVFAQVTSEVDEVVERVLCAVLGKSVRARFVDKARMDTYQPAAPAAGTPEGAQASQASHTEEAASPSEPVEETDLDPVMQYLVSQGGEIQE